MAGTMNCAQCRQGEALPAQNGLRCPATHEGLGHAAPQQPGKAGAMLRGERLQPRPSAKVGQDLAGEGGFVEGVWSWVEGVWPVWKGQGFSCLPKLGHHPLPKADAAQAKEVPLRDPVAWSYSDQFYIEGQNRCWTCDSI